MRLSNAKAAPPDWKETNPNYQVGKTRHLRDGSIEIDAGRIADSWSALREHYARCGVPSMVDVAGRGKPLRGAG